MKSHGRGRRSDRGEGILISGQFKMGESFKLITRPAERSILISHYKGKNSKGIGDKDKNSDYIIR